MMSVNMSSCQSFELAPAPTNVMTANVSGWLMKKKNKDLPADANWKIQAWQKACTAILGQYNKRFFWMDFNINLVYYAESPHSKRVAFIPFSRLRGVSAVSSPVKINAAREGWVWGITLRTVNRSLDLWTQSEAEQLMWLDALGKAITSDTTHQSIISQSSAALTQSAVLSVRQLLPSTPQLSDNNMENRWGEVNSMSKTQSATNSFLPPIKERATWDALSDDAAGAPVNGHMQQQTDTTPKQTATRKWDDWDN
jgi:hypothetical protein